MKTPLLSAAMIVKNEERNLPGCLDALAELGDLVSEVCIYDTGSTDRTVEIAQERGCRVEIGYWDQDFARARQAAADMASSEWVLSVDADEHITADALRLRDLLERGIERGWDAVMVSVVDRRDGVDVQSHVADRFFRPARAHWAGRVHEHIVSSSGRPDPVSHAAEREVVTLIHYGYGAEVDMAAKHGRNLALAEAEAEDAEAMGDNEALVRALVDGARSLMALGEGERAVEALERVRLMSSMRTYRTVGLELLADALVNRNQHERALEVVGQLRAEGVSDPSYCDWLEARARAGKGEVRTALRLLRGIETLRTSLGLSAMPHHLLHARLKAAVALGEYTEGAACLISLMAGEGVFHRRHGDLLLKLTQGVPAPTLAQMLIEHDRGHLAAVADELDRSMYPGHEIARELREHLHQNVAGESGEMAAQVSGRA